MIYKFRVQFEDFDDVYRDIDIDTLQTFEDFKIAILRAIGFDEVHESAFFMSDDLWRQGKDLSKKKDGSPMPLSKRVICDYIDAPHQRFLFIYDLNVQWSFLIELIKIAQSEPKLSYPLVAKSIGTPPRQYKVVYVPAPADEEDEDGIPKAKRGRKPGVKKEAEPIAEIDDDLDENDEAEEVEETVYIEESDIEEGFGDEGEEEDKGKSGEDDDDGFGDSEEESFDDFSSSEDDY